MEPPLQAATLSSVLVERGVFSCSRGCPEPLESDREVPRGPGDSSVSSVRLRACIPLEEEEAAWVAVAMGPLTPLSVLSTEEGRTPPGK